MARCCPVAVNILLGCYRVVSAVFLTFASKDGEEMLQKEVDTVHYKQY